MITTVDVVILAAGSSTRFGSDKRLLTLKPLLKVIASALGNMEYRLLCVLKAGDEKNIHELLGDFRFHPHLLLLMNEQPEQGMGSSLALAATQLNAEVAMVFLADMPFILPETILQLLVRSGVHHITAPVYENQRGHPVCFGAHYFSGLRQLEGEFGARQLIVQHLSQLHLLETSDKGVVVDIDTAVDWARMRVHETFPGQDIGFLPDNLYV